MEVTLLDGTVAELDRYDNAALDGLHWEQERGYAQRIRQSQRGSQERARAFAEGYNTVTKILTHRKGATGGLVMGMSPRFPRLVLKLLRRQRACGVANPKLFEIGYGCGAVLDVAARAGFEVTGIEVSSHMREQALEALDAAQHDRLYLGDYLTHDLGGIAGQVNVMYWNDVFEHLPPDESLDYLRKTFDLLSPGGVLLTITPNWHVRPSDITDLVRPKRSEPEGFHLKEYTLGEMISLLSQAGFVRVSTPLVVTHEHTILCGRGLAGLKSAAEPLLEWLPFSIAKLLCRGLALSCTLAYKLR